MNKHNTQVLLLLGTVTVALIVLSAGLSELEFLPGQPPPLGEYEDIVNPLMIGEYPFLEALFPIVGALVLAGLIIYGILSSGFRQAFLSSVSVGVLAALLIPTLALFLWLLFRLVVLVVTFLTGPGPPLELEPDLPFAEAPPALPASDTPSWLGMTVLVAMIALLSGVLIWRYLRDRKCPSATITQKAESALRDLRAGADLKDTVLRCYAEMSQILEQERGIKRQQAMTPREFGRYLEEAGWRDEHIEQLTHLFENVRYGGKTPDEREEREAEACLTSIVQTYGRSQ